MSRTIPCLVVAAISFVAPALAQSKAGAARAATPAAPAAAGIAAYLGERAISEAELEASLKSRLLRIRQEAYEAKLEGLKDLAFGLLQEQEAASLAISRDELFRKNVTDKAAAPTDAEIQDIFARFRSRLPGDDDQARKEVSERLRERNLQLRAKAWREELLAGARLRILLEPPRTELAIEPDDPTIGSAVAPVTLVEFSDYQCPYCAQAQASLQQLRAAYPDKLRMVFKQLPLPMHPQARLAAEAVLCATDQGKLAEAREWLFGHRTKLSPEAIKGWAAEAKLDATVFNACLDEHRHAKTVDGDLAYAASIEVNSTPTFFINGRLISGARPFEQLKEIVEQELARSAAPAAAAAAK
ncbi:MAG: thioredoxin domain-containing protein [Acidobacteriota bacterium]